MKATSNNRKARGAPRRRSLVIALAVALIAAVAPSLTASVGAADPAKPVSMRLLVIAADGNETDYPAITTFLDEVGVPYDKILAADTPLTASMLSDGTTGRYQGIVLTTGNLTYFDAGAGTWQSAFSPDEWATLRQYQKDFHVRSVTSYTFPEASYGLSYAGYRNTLGSELPATLTAAGQAVWPYVNAANPIELTGAWVYLGSILDPSVTTPLVNVTVDGTTYPVASVTRFDGYENLAVTAANNPNLLHSILLSTGWINWVSGGNFLGNRSSSIDVQIDDLFIGTDQWDPATNTAHTEYTNVPADVTAMVAYQNARRANPATPGFKVEYAFNGAGGPTNPSLVNTVRANRSQFGFINHTWTHFNLDCGDCPNPTGQITTNTTQIRSQILTNRMYGALLGLPGNSDTMVQPDISGINTPPNPMAQKAAGGVGIRFWIGDTSRAGQTNPTFNTGFATAGDSRVFVVPRRPTNLFVAATTPDQWTSVYNHFYAPGGILCGMTTCFDRPQTYQEILDHESDYLLRYLLRGDLDPWMFHVGNTRAYSGNRSVLSDLLDETFSKYSSMVNTPVRSVSFKQAGQAMQGRAAYNAAGVTATVTPCTSITVKATKAATVPVNGVAYTAANSTVEHYGGRTISQVRLAAGQTVTIPLPAC